MAHALRIGLIGWGTVGSAFGELVASGPLPLRLSRVGVRSPNAATSWMPDVPVSSAETLVQADDVDVVVELAGGVDAPRGWARATLGRGRAYVTANKALLATHGGELAELAQQHEAVLLGSASVGGGTPMIEVVEHLSATGRVRALRGLLNATTTFILSRMAEGRTYAAALAEAQEAGYAEADPSFDVEGRDAAQKLAILASVAWGTWRSEREVDTAGIVGVVPGQGQVVRLLASADADGMRVAPTQLHPESRLAVTSGIEGVLEVTMADGEVFTAAGPGAGGVVTAGAVYADLARLVAGERPILFGPRS